MVSEVWLCVEAFGQTEAIKYLGELIGKRRKCSREGERVAERRKTEGKGNNCFTASCKAENIVCGKTFEEKYSFTVFAVFEKFQFDGKSNSVFSSHPTLGSKRSRVRIPGREEIDYVYLLSRRSLCSPGRKLVMQIMEAANICYSLSFSYL